MVYVVLITLSDIAENEIKCFNSYQKAQEYAREAHDPTADSGGWVQVFSYEPATDTQVEIPKTQWNV